ncbi:aluminum-activated malate transporter 8-like [Cornus florida]|uniref:aluminum-activated malate transporter 8-like n=1 Tax=Cornus florida TaxID=4283 RepID=UPI00289AFB97|nr:aluminum-activated malate transporter 8-like [Cornus florida]
MEIESSNRTKTGLKGSCWCGRIKSLPIKFKDKVIEIMQKTKKIGQDDPRKIVHALKVGLALTLVSMVYHVRPLYDGFGEFGMWAILTVVVVLEFTVGATLSKGLNRGFATFLAGALGVGAVQLATLFGEKGQPIVLAFLVFLIAAASTFTRFFPHIKQRYDYGVLIFILTFSLVTVSGYRVEKILELAHHRVSTIILGGATCMIISIFVCPAWAGEDLHKLIGVNIERLGNFLEGFGSEYLKLCEDGGNKQFLQVYKSVLNTKTTEESLANFAWWEPCHGRFRLHHPWKQYLKIGVLARQCAYKIEALNGFIINSDNQAPSEIQRRIKAPCTKMSSESGKALKQLASSIRTMTQPSSPNLHVEIAKIAIDEFNSAMEAASPESTQLLQVIPSVTVASILIEIINCVEKIEESINELSQLAHFKSSVELSTVTPERPQFLHLGSIKPVRDGDGDGDGDGGHVVITVRGTSPDSPQEGNPQALRKSQPAEV